MEIESYGPSNQNTKDIASFYRSQSFSCVAQPLQEFTWLGKKVGHQVLASVAILANFGVIFKHEGLVICIDQGNKPINFQQTLKEQVPTMPTFSVNIKQRKKKKLPKFNMVE